MARRMSKYLHPVNTLKHTVDSQGGLVAGTVSTVNLVKGTDAPVIATNPEQCHIDSHVRSIFLNVQVSAIGTAALANVYMMIYGNPGANVLAAQIPNPNVVGTSDFRKMVFHQEMTMTEKNTTAIPRTLFKGVLKIPRKFNRIGASDLITIALLSPGVDYEYCIQCIYKEIR